jgi:hypothetical protein
MATTTTTTTHRCALCQEAATKRCSRCKTVWYCSTEHQRTDWKNHKKECNETEQLELHKKEFDRIIKAYRLDQEERSEEIASFLTQGKDAKNTVSAPAFAEKFGLKVEEAVVFLEWIKIGVRFKETSIDVAKKSGLS